MALTHAERRARRKRIAKYAENHTDSDSARNFGVSPHTVRLARNEFGVLKTPEPSPSSFSIIADLILGKKMSDVARSHRVSRQFVHQVKRKMEKCGIMNAVHLVRQS